MSDRTIKEIVHEVFDLLQKHPHMSKTLETTAIDVLESKFQRDIREQTNEVVEALGAQLTVPDFFHHISCDCGQCVNLKNANKKGMRQAVEKALTKLKQIRGEK